MAKQNLASMSIEALVKLRNDIGSVLKRKADALKKELASIGVDYAEVGRIAIYGRKSKRPVPVKYRDPQTGQTWSGRGAPAGWIAAHEKEGRKREQYLIAKPAKTAKIAKKKNPRKKNTKKARKKAKSVRR